MFDYEYWGMNTLSIDSNMALEEYMLNRSEKLGVATVRFWNVEKDAVVIGYGESLRNVKKIDGSFDLARRITGGSHVQFSRNCLAYTFTAPRDGSFRHYDEMRKYYAEKIGDALAELGIEVSKVDNKASTINVDGKVIASHAMFWGVKSALMHGLIIIDRYDVDKILERVVLKERKIGNNTYREYDALKNMPIVSELMAKRLAYADKEAKSELAKKILSEEILRQVTRGKHVDKAVTRSVVYDANALVERAHAGTPWVKDRVPPYSKDEVDAIPGEELEGKLRDNLGYCMYIQVADKDFAKMALPSE